MLTAPGTVRTTGHRRRSCAAPASGRRCLHRRSTTIGNSAMFVGLPALAPAPDAEPAPASQHQHALLQHAVSRSLRCHISTSHARASGTRHGVGRAPLRGGHTCEHDGLHRNVGQLCHDLGEQVGQHCVGPCRKQKVALLGKLVVLQALYQAALRSSCKIFEVPPRGLERAQKCNVPLARPVQSIQSTGA